MNQRVHPLVVGLVVFHVIAITIYTLPKPIEGVLTGELEPRGTDALLKYNHQVLKEKPLVAGYLLPTGLWQYWDMFAPEPSQMDLWASAEVEFYDGTRTEFRYPRVKELGIAEKYVNERYRKLYERLSPDENRYCWPVMGHSIAVKMATDKNNPPVKVDLIRHFQWVLRHDAESKVEPPYQTYRYHTHVVDQNLLAKDMGWQPRVSKRGNANGLP